MLLNCSPLPQAPLSLPLISSPNLYPYPYPYLPLAGNLIAECAVLTKQDQLRARPLLGARGGAAGIASPLEEVWLPMHSHAWEGCRPKPRP